MKTFEPTKRKVAMISQPMGAWSAISKGGGILGRCRG